MTFGEHLEELRKVLVKALLGILVGTAIGLYFGNAVVRLLVTPLERALLQHEQGLMMERMRAADGWIPDDLQVWMQQSQQAPRKVFVDMQQLIQELAKAMPSLADQVPLRAELNFPFKPGGLERFCQRLNQPETNDPFRGQIDWLREQMSATERQSLTEFASAKESPAMQQWAQQLLTTWSDQAPMMSAPEFARSFAEPSFWESLWQSKTQQNPFLELKRAWEKKQDPEIERSLNRSLLAQMFSTELDPPRRPLVALQTWQELDLRPQALGSTDAFMIWMKAGLFTGLLLSSPWVFYQIWQFVAAGLYPHEKQYVHWFLPISLGLFLSGMMLAFLFVFDPVLEFLFSFNSAMGIDIQPRINEWFSFVLFLPLGFGIAFQLPLVMLFLNRIGLISVQTYLEKWRIAIMVVFVISMILTPAEPVSMLLMAVPLTFLYFLGIGLCHWLPTPKNPFQDELESGSLSTT